MIIILEKNLNHFLTTLQPLPRQICTKKSRVFPYGTHIGPATCALLPFCAFNVRYGSTFNTTSGYEKRKKVAERLRKKKKILHWFKIIIWESAVLVCKSKKQ